MAQLNKHKLLWDCYDLCQTIEECGCSDAVTQATTMCSELLDDIERYVDKVSEFKKLATELVKYTDSSNTHCCPREERKHFVEFINSFNK